MDKKDEIFIIAFNKFAKLFDAGYDLLKKNRDENLEKKCILFIQSFKNFEANETKILNSSTINNKDFKLYLKSFNDLLNFLSDVDIFHYHKNKKIIQENVSENIYFNNLYNPNIFLSNLFNNFNKIIEDNKKYDLNIFNKKILVIT